MIKSKKTFKSLTLLSLGSLVSSGSAFLIYIILARQIGPESFGVFSSSMAIIKTFLLLAGFGIPQFWLKAFGKEGWNGIRWVKPSLYFVFFSLMLIVITIFLFTVFVPKVDATNFLLQILIFFIFGNISVQLVSSKLQLEERYEVLALWQLAPNLLRLVIVILCFYVLNFSINEKGIGIIYAIIGVIFVMLGIKQFILMLRGQISLKGHDKHGSKVRNLPTISDVVKEAWPFGAANLFAFIYMQSDIIMVKYISGNQAAGFYNVSFVILSALLLIPTILFSKYLLPKYHRWASHDKTKLYNTYKKGNLTMILIGSICMILILMLASYFIPLIFGEEYIPAVNIFKILSLSLPISFLSYSVGATLVTNEHMKMKVKLMFVVAVFNIIFNLLVIPEYGAMGAAISTVISNVLLLILYFYNAQKLVFKKAYNE